MPDVPRLDDEDDVLGDIGGVVADALEVAGDQNQVDGGLDRPRIAQHVGQQLAKNLILQRVEPVVLPQHRLRQTDVARDEGVERLAQHLERQLTHPRQIDQRLDRRMQEVALRRLADVDGEVADALQVGVDLEGRHDRSQIDRDGLVQARAA